MRAPSSKSDGHVKKKHSKLLKLSNSCDHKSRTWSAQSSDDPGQNMDRHFLLYLINTELTMQVFKNYLTISHVQSLSSEMSLPKLFILRS